MSRYRIREDSNSTKTLLVAAGVVVGILAGAAVAHRLGGWRGIVRRLERGRGPLFDLLRDNVSPDKVEGLLASGRELVALFSGEPTRTRARRRRGYDAVLDEYEVEDYERAAAGVDLDDDPDDDLDGDVEDERERERERDRRPERGAMHLLDDEDGDGGAGAYVDEYDDADAGVGGDASFDASAIEHEVLRLFRRNRALRRRPIEIACDDDGVVELSGVVHSEREARAARRLALRVDGVSRVAVRLEVREPQAS